MRVLREALAPIGFMLLIAGAILLLRLLTGCALLRPAEEPKLPEYCYDEDLLRAKVFACVASAETKLESQACRKQSLKTCGIEVTP